MRPSDLAGGHNPCSPWDPALSPQGRPRAPRQLWVPLSAPDQQKKRLASSRARSREGENQRCPRPGLPPVPGGPGEGRGETIHRSSGSRAGAGSDPTAPSRPRPILPVPVLPGPGSAAGLWQSRQWGIVRSSDLCFLPRPAWAFSGAAVSAGPVLSGDPGWAEPPRSHPSTVRGGPAWVNLQLFIRA